MSCLVCGGTALPAMASSGQVNSVELEIYDRLHGAGLVVTPRYCPRCPNTCSLSPPRAYRVFPASGSGGNDARAPRSAGNISARLERPGGRPPCR
jgi:hypothetical protein